MFVFFIVYKDLSFFKMFYYSDFSIEISVFVKCVWLLILLFLENNFEGIIFVLLVFC